MSLYRCAVCGSPNVQRSDSNDGFSYKKALVGTAVFGTVGAVAGINGKKTIQYLCPDCGYIGSTAMNDMEKTIVDMAVSSSEELFQRMPSFQTYVQKYSYLAKERTMKSSQDNSNAFTDPVGTTNLLQSEYTLAEVRQAAEDFYAAFNENPWLCNVDPPYWTGTPIQDIAVYEKGFQALRVIAYGLYAYPMLIVGDYDGDAFSRYSLKRAFVAFILVTYGQMSINEMYKFARNDPYLSRTMDALINQEDYQRAIQPRKSVINDPAHPLHYPDKEQEYIKEFFGETSFGVLGHTSQYGCVKKSDIFVVAAGYENDWSGFPSDDKRVRSWEVYNMPDYNTPLEFGYKMCNNSLYVASVNVLKAAEQEHPEPTQKIVALLKQKADKKDEDKNLLNAYLKENKGLSEEKKRFEGRIQSLNAEAAALRSKFFGKKKNEALATGKERDAQEIQQKIKENEAKEKAAKDKWQSGKAAIQKDCDEIDRQIRDCKIQRSAYYREIDRWVCIAGPDCSIPPQENPADIQARERAEQSFQVFEGKNAMETNENIKTRVYEVLRKSGKKMMVSEIMEADDDLAGFSNMKIAALVNALVFEDRAIKTVENRRSYFQAK